MRTVIVLRQDESSRDAADALRERGHLVLEVDTPREALRIAAGMRVEVLLAFWSDHPTSARQLFDAFRRQHAQTRRLALFEDAAAKHVLGEGVADRELLAPVSLSALFRAVENDTSTQ